MIAVPENGDAADHHDGRIFLLALHLRVVAQMPEQSVLAKTILFGADRRDLYPHDFLSMAVSIIDRDPLLDLTLSGGGDRGL